MGKTLTDLEELVIREVVGSFTNKKNGAMFFRGSNPINGIWASSDLSISHACILPVGYGIGDHQLFVIDITTADILGSNLPVAKCVSSFPMSQTNMLNYWKGKSSTTKS